MWLCKWWCVRKSSLTINLQGQKRGTLDVWRLAHVHSWMPGNPPQPYFFIWASSKDTSSAEVNQRLQERNSTQKAKALLVLKTLLTDGHSAPEQKTVMSPASLHTPCEGDAAESWEQRDVHGRCAPPWSCPDAPCTQHVSLKSWKEATVLCWGGLTSLQRQGRVRCEPEEWEGSLLLYSSVYESYTSASGLRQRNKKGKKTHLAQ